MTPTTTMNIIGCGRLGKTLACLWRKHDMLQVQDVVNRSLPSAQAAIDFIGAGTACGAEELHPADITLIATDDASIAACAAQLDATGILRPGDIVFHCSGALGSEILAPLRRCKALLASVHPIKSFADPASATSSFPGTFCGIEGDRPATERLKPLFEGIGGKLLPLSGDTKTLYHAAMTISANYLVTLMQMSIETLEQAGLPAETALQVLEPMVRNTVDNIFTLGPGAALTGPIARRDGMIVKRHVDALRTWQPDMAKLYQALGRKTLEVAQNHKAAAAAKEQAMQNILKNGETD
ncbi:protein of unknown function DUF2520 [Syntrophotalea carbinolica DSM 2380]|uniref:DUF2520 domain-containing protein n=1 Tax=Syntrophotalea carbinolica (strain DSM 2380 / NBRC 103641 / GraBd1) TaxID=338963 RepID=Q3A4Z1_SYNC1|nr:Rossmann-like and DUF2520 domain-containing protein [Syntrophotalea carbinolica]ABA88566.1 protein of unknown function DUF2520 [Syntrophotalea carbinolica DSM 2380]